MRLKVRKNTGKPKKSPSDYPHLTFRPTRMNHQKLEAMVVRHGEKRNSLLNQALSLGLHILDSQPKGKAA